MKRVKRLLVVGPGDHYGGGIIRGIHRYCSTHGRWEYQLESEWNVHAAKRWRAAIGSWKADGIIAHVRDIERVRAIRRTGLPAVNVSGAFSSNLATVRPDNKAVGRMAADHFMESGFRNFAFCAVTPDMFAQERCEGFVDRLGERNFRCSVFTDEFREKGEEKWVENHRRMDRWIVSLKKPVGVLGVYDMRAHDVSWACQRLRLRVPDDVAIVGIDNYALHCFMCNPPLSSIDLDLERVGFAAARLVDRMMHGAKAPTRPLLVLPRGIVVRQSSDVVATDDQDVAATIRFIRDHAGEPISVKDILQAVPVSRKTLERRFEQVIGRTPAAELARVRMERAKQLLNNTNLLIPQVAQKCGFNDPKVFTASFHRRIGMTPTRYRQDCRTHVGN